MFLEGNCFYFLFSAHKQKVVCSVAQVGSYPTAAEARNTAAEVMPEDVITVYQVSTVAANIEHLEAETHSRDKQKLSSMKSEQHKMETQSLSGRGGTSGLAKPSLLA